MKISEVMKLTGLTKRAIGFYEQEGLISPAVDQENSYRNFGPDEISRLMQISLLRQLDFSVSEIKKILNEPDQLREILTLHLEKIKHKMNQLETNKVLIEDLIQKAKPTLSPQEYTVKLQKLKNALELEDQEKYGYMKRQLLRIFPGVLGKILTLHFAPFLNEEIDTEEKKRAWLELIHFLDKPEVIKYPDEYEKALAQMSEEDLEEMTQYNQARMDRLLKASEQEFEDIKAETMEAIKVSLAKESFQELHNKMKQVNEPIKKRMSEIGYYDLFIKNMCILSQDYDQYQKRLKRLNDELGLSYDSEGNIQFKK